MLRWIVLTLALWIGAVPAAAAENPTWSREDAAALLQFVETIGSDGLDPADYDVEALRHDLAGAQQPIDARATRTFLHIASDLQQGHVRNRSAMSWFIGGPTFTETEGLSLLDKALTEHSVAETLRSLAPQHRQYQLLKQALAATPAKDIAATRRLRANLERWRWMPRDLGRRYLLVNAPAYTVSLVENGRVVAQRKVIVGKPATPTPQFSATVTGVIVNPWWDVPDSIVKESVGALVRRQPSVARQRGYVVQGGRIRQRPGPGNSLGQLKLVMANPYRVYLHDTPSKALFDQQARAFSHGCIRTQDIAGLAAELLDGTPGWSRGAIDRAIAAGTTVQVDVARPLPIYVTYFTASVDDSGTLAVFPDVYHRDERIVAQLIDRELN